MGRDAASRPAVSRCRIARPAGMRRVSCDISASARCRSVTMVKCAILRRTGTAEEASVESRTRSRDRWHGHRRGERRRRLRRRHDHTPSRCAECPQARLPAPIAVIVRVAGPPPQPPRCRCSTPPGASPTPAEQPRRCPLPEPDDVASPSIVQPLTGEPAVADRGAVRRRRRGIRVRGMPRIALGRASAAGRRPRRRMDPRLEPKAAEKAAKTPARAAELNDSAGNRPTSVPQRRAHRPDADQSGSTSGSKRDQSRGSPRLTRLTVAGSPQARPLPAPGVPQHRGLLRAVRPSERSLPAVAGARGRSTMWWAPSLPRR